MQIKTLERFNCKEVEEAMNNNQDQVCEHCGKIEFAHIWKYGRQWCVSESFEWKPKPTPDPKVECEFCGPTCYKGAAHNARVEDNARWNDPKVEFEKFQAHLDHCSAEVAKWPKEIYDAQRAAMDLPYRERDLKVKQVAKRPELIHIEDNISGLSLDVFSVKETKALIDSQEKELRIYKKVLGKFAKGDLLEWYLEAARKEQSDGE